VRARNFQFGGGADRALFAIHPKDDFPVSHKSAVFNRMPSGKPEHMPFRLFRHGGDQGIVRVEDREILLGLVIQNHRLSRAVVLHGF
jgi:hypothetical protein